MMKDLDAAKKELSLIAADLTIPSIEEEVYSLFYKKVHP